MPIFKKIAHEHIADLLLVKSQGMNFYVLMSGGSKYSFS